MSWDEAAQSWLVAPAVGSLVAAIAGSLGWRHRPLPRRLLELSCTRPTARPLSDQGAPTKRSSAVIRAARAITRLVTAIGRLARRASGLNPDAGLERRLGFALVGACVAGVVSAPAALPTGAAIWCAPWLIGRMRAKRRADRVLDEMPEAIDLLRLALGSGSSLRLAVSAIAPRCGPTVGAGFGRVDRQLDRGVPLGEALRELEALGVPFRTVLQALTASERYGSPIVPVLDRIAADTRAARRRRAEERARRVPVKLLFPLVFCTLPAFGLLTVVPLLASALGRMSF